MEKIKSGMKFNEVAATYSEDKVCSNFGKKLIFFSGK